jgi:hypothetical protein
MCPWLALSIHVPPFPTMPAGRRGANQKAQGTTVPWAGPRALQRPMRIQSCYVQYRRTLLFFYVFDKYITKENIYTKIIGEYKK